MNAVERTLRYAGSSGETETYVKRYALPEAMWQEWTALNECRGPGIQRVISIDPDAQMLTLAFDPDAVPLSTFGEADLGLFMKVLPAIVSVIQHCHGRGWVHGDIKPSNILYVPATQTIRLIDFGASHRIGTSREALSEWQATPMFASPQQMNGEGLVHTGDDWYALMKIIDQVMPLVHDRLLLRTIRGVRAGVVADFQYSERTTI
ncbi:protein kinase [Photobacterium sp. CCB-ST2H9]|uniref:protein kinase domain-containing protein n=1 Tax=Photobacterium sp. CCB-ST2H9 TaxID=2912855 RepID=UPI0020063D72|nr:protein kinase [Photobacterium sp. CCB-ST2H9]UTM57045.1 protein kinase [Photobacterium sp. CCB-ST2H9]